MNKKERAFLEALLIKISRDPQTAFYSKDILDHKLVKWDDLEYLLNDTYRVTPECVELIN